MELKKATVPEGGRQASSKEALREGAKERRKEGGERDEDPDDEVASARARAAKGRGAKLEKVATRESVVAALQAVNARLIEALSKVNLFVGMRWAPWMAVGRDRRSAVDCDLTRSAECCGLPSAAIGCV